MDSTASQKSLENRCRRRLGSPSVSIGRPRPASPDLVRSVGDVLASWRERESAIWSSRKDAKDFAPSRLAEDADVQNHRFGVNACRELAAFEAVR
jgi:hypothetical protein